MHIILPINNDGSENSNNPYYLYVYHLPHLRKTYKNPLSYEN